MDNTATAQAYVSRELTHFAGKGRARPEQFATLLEILTSGHLLTRSSQKGNRDSQGLRINKEAQISLDEMYEADMVCFCDIPVGDLGIHMTKYGSFGLSFLKPFLISQGASPVFYQAMNAPLVVFKTPPQLGVDLAAIARRAEAGEDLGALASRLVQELHTSTRAQQFDRMIPAFRRLLERIRDILHERDEGDQVMMGRLRDQFLAKEGADEQPLHYSEIEAFITFLDFDVFSYFKFFDDSKADDDPKNFYMEREWRVLDDVKFELKDVARIIVPSQFERLLREQLPSYVGEVTIVEG